MNQHNSLMSVRCHKMGLRPHEEKTSVMEGLCADRWHVFHQGHAGIDFFGRGRMWVVHGRFVHWLFERSKMRLNPFGYQVGAVESVEALTDTLLKAFKIPVARVRSVEGHDDCLKVKCVGHLHVHDVFRSGLQKSSKNADLEGANIFCLSSRHCCVE